jgi:glycosyltransferase involved in cell wall biosynthesis
LSETDKLKILVLEPYYGGSHKTFLDGLRKLPFYFKLMTLPARKWKWRMRLSASYYAGKLYRLNEHFDRILCSTFVDVAAFRGLAPPWVREVPLLTYFHENQFAYPVQHKDERDLHFALTNITTALASDSLAFNSSYNLSSFLSDTEKLMKKSPDLKLDKPSRILKDKSRIIPPGIDFSVLDTVEEPLRGRTPVLVWNHRWEHDKNPEMFFQTLFDLDSQGLDFSLVVLGQSFQGRPAVFNEVRKRLSHRILHMGYVRSRRDYFRLLKGGTIVVSTALHEFFGLAVIEAIRAGCRPLLPRRLSYPELFPGEYLYDEENLIHRLKEEITLKRQLSKEKALALTDRFSWNRLAPDYTAWLSEAKLHYY